MVRGTVEETLNASLDAEADRLCGAGRYELTQGRQNTRAGGYERSLHTVACEVNLKVPKLRRQTFETTIIERYRRRESSVEEAPIETYLAGFPFGRSRTSPRRYRSRDACRKTLLSIGATNPGGLKVPASRSQNAALCQPKLLCCNALLLAKMACRIA